MPMTQVLSWWETLPSAPTLLLPHNLCDTLSLLTAWLDLEFHRRFRNTSSLWRPFQKGLTERLSRPKCRQHRFPGRRGRSSIWKRRRWAMPSTSVPFSLPHIYQDVKITSTPCCYHHDAFTKGMGLTCRVAPLRAWAKITFSSCKLLLSGSLSQRQEKIASAYPVGSEVLLLRTRLALKSLSDVSLPPQHQPQSCRLLGIVTLEILNSVQFMWTTHASMLKPSN